MNETVLAPHHTRGPQESRRLVPEQYSLRHKVGAPTMASTRAGHPTPRGYSDPAKADRRNRIRRRQRFVK